MGRKNIYDLTQGDDGIFTRIYITYTWVEE